MDAVGSASGQGLDTLRAGFLAVADDLVVVHWDTVLEEWTGLSAEDVIGHPLPRRLTAMPQSWVDTLSMVLASGQPALLAGAPGLFPAIENPVAVALGNRAWGRAHAVLAVLEGGPALAAQGPTDPDDVPEIRARIDELGMAEDPEFLAESLREFLRTAEELMDQIRRGFGSGEHQVTARAAHRLAGSALTLGAQELGRLAMAVEQHAASPGEELDQLMAALEMDAERTFRFCRRLSG